MSSFGIFEDLKDIEYAKAWAYQEELLSQFIALKKEGHLPKHRLLFCEHPNVYTLGKSGARNNLLVDDQFLKSINASYYETNRGGDITYHGPGQLVGYPILDLEQMGFQVKKYIDKLENAIINTLKYYDIKGQRLEGATGVWLDIDKAEKTRKICAMGVRVSRWVTMHGFALNVNTDLQYFNYIHPCGFVDKGVTSLQKELGKTINFESLKKIVRAEIEKEFNIQFE
ncbi:MAG: lipoyl(octanoyl) transferase LipB [Bacteroidales bacterium]|nr:lipoyl(octanoyl) transferase LipB [Bacteroidales bacterium]